MVDPSVLRYYGEGSEAERLVAGEVERLEFIRTKELLSRSLGDRPLDILDVGGASGRYASWLAGLGHNVQLIDPVPLHIDQARDMAASGDFFEASRGDARSLAFRDESFDVVPARVNLSEADFLGNHCVLAVSSLGSLIQTAVGSAGGWGGLRTKRSGCSAYATLRTTARCSRMSGARS